MNDLSKLIDALEVKFFKLNQKLVQLEKKNQEMVELLEQVKKDNEVKAAQVTSLNEQDKFINS